MAARTVACPGARRRGLAPTAPDRRCTTRPAMPLPRARDRGRHALLGPSTRRTTRQPELVAGPRVVANASAQLKPVGVCVDMPPLLLETTCRSENRLRLPEVHDEKPL